MKSYMIHECEYTGWVSENPEEIQRHEAVYLGISTETLKKYNILKWRLDVYYEITTRTQLWPDWKQWLLSVQELRLFEQKYGIKHRPLVIPQRKER